MITYSQNPQTELNAKIHRGLHHELQQIKGHLCPFETHNLYAFEEDTLVGGVIFERHDDILWIDSLWVAELQRKQGIGQKLLQHVMDIGHAHHCEKIQLTTYFANCLPFYEKQGFVILSSLPHWKYGVECYFLEKILEDKTQ